MLVNELQTRVNQSDALIISCADSCHYLAAVSQKWKCEEGNFELIRDTQGKIMRFNGLPDAKDFFHKAGFGIAHLVVQSAYDEMGDTEESNATSAMDIHLN